MSERHVKTLKSCDYLTQNIFLGKVLILRRNLSLFCYMGSELSSSGHRLHQVFEKSCIPLLIMPSLYIKILISYIAGIENYAL